MAKKRFTSIRKATTFAVERINARCTYLLFQPVSTRSWEVDSRIESVEFSQEIQDRHAAEEKFNRELAISLIQDQKWKLVFFHLNKGFTADSSQSLWLVESQRNVTLQKRKFTK